MRSVSVSTVSLRKNVLFDIENKSTKKKKKINVHNVQLNSGMFSRSKSLASFCCPFAFKSDSQQFHQRDSDLVYLGF